jgi:hypothetical protein
LKAENKQKCVYIYFAASWTLLAGATLRVAPRSYAHDSLHYGKVFKGM